MRDLILIIFGGALAATLNVAFPKSFDERKWEQMAARREARRATEARYEKCLTACREKCVK